MLLVWSITFPEAPSFREGCAILRGQLQYEQLFLCILSRFPSGTGSPFGYVLEAASKPINLTVALDTDHRAEAIIPRKEIRKIRV